MVRDCSKNSDSLELWSVFHGLFNWVYVWGLIGTDSDGKLSENLRCVEAQLRSPFNFHTNCTAWNSSQDKS